MTERRRYRRVKDGVRVIYKVLGVNGESQMHSLDIGAGGLRLPLKDKLDPGTLLELGLFLPQDREPFFCLTRVVWQADESKKDKGDQGYYETGVEFVRIDIRQRLRLIHYVYPLLRKNKNETE